MSSRTLPKFILLTSVMLTSLAMSDVWAKSSVWKVSKGNDYIYVGGTVHILPPSEFPLPEEFEQAYKKSDSIVLEAKLPDANDVAFQMQMMQQVTYSNGKDITAFLSKKTNQQLKKYAASLGTDLTMLKHFKPGFLVTMFAVFEAQRAGFVGEGVDMFYSQKAARDNKDIEYFESAQFQMDMIANMGAGHEEKFIKSNLKQMKDFKKMFKDTLVAWRKGDEKQLYNVAIKPMKSDPKTFKTMLTDRNRNWIQDIDKMFNDNDREFVLVGVAHLVGRDSVLDLLKAKGYAVKAL